jgi:hypothetical protein
MKNRVCQKKIDMGFEFDDLEYIATSRAIIFFRLLLLFYIAYSVTQ